MSEDDEGFLFPEIKEKDKCISCGMCMRVCPMTIFKGEGTAPTCYYGWLKDERTYAISTSGGAYSAICIYAQKEGYSYVYGSLYNENGTVVHCGQPIENYSKFIGTKYVQSELGNTFSEIKNRITNGEKIVFVGTPCQVEGLLKYIGKKCRDNLLAISLVCHNTASPKAYKKYLSELDGNICYVRFRDKRHVASGSSTTLVYNNGDEISDPHNLYTTVFGLGLICRHSCNICPFTTIYRNADITIGDFWGLESIKPELNDQSGKGISLILAHTEKGKRAVSLISEIFHCEEIDVKYALNEKQPQLSRPHELNPNRDQFMRRTLIEGKSFCKEAKRQIDRWKLRNRIKRYLHI